MDKFTNSQKSGGKVRKNKLGDMTFNSNDLNLLDLRDLNYLNNQLNTNHLNNLNANQLNRSLPPEFLTNLNSLNNLATGNATSYNTSMHTQFGNQFNKNAITSGITSQSSMVYSNAPFYQQQSKLTLSSNLDNNHNNNTFAFNPYPTAALQHSLLNVNFLHNTVYHPKPINTSDQQQLLMQTNFNSLNSGLGNLNSINGLSNNTSSNSSLDNSLVNNRPTYLAESDTNNLSLLNYLNVFNKSLNTLNESFLPHNLLYPNQLLNNNFNFNFLNSPLINTSTQQQTQPSHAIVNNQKCKRPKLESTVDRKEVKDYLKKNELEFNIKGFNFLNDLKKGDRLHEVDLKDVLKDNLKNDLKNERKDDSKDDLKDDVKDDLKNDLKDDLEDDLKNNLKDDFEDNLAAKNEKASRFEELKVQTTNDHDKLEEEKKFSPDSSTELNTIMKEQNNHIHIIKCVNNQSPIITSTKSSEHSTSPDVQLNSSFNSMDQNCKLLNDGSMKRSDDDINEKEFVKFELLNEISNHDIENSLENDEEHSLKIDLNEELSSDENSNNEHISFTKSVDYKDLHTLISKKSFQTPTNFKEVSLDRMSFDEDEEDKSPINFNFNNLIDNDLNCIDNKDELIDDKKIKSKRRNRDNDSNSVNSNPWSIRRSERIFLNEAFNNNSNNCFNLNIKNQDFNLTLKDLEEPQRILLQSDDLLYCGMATKDGISGKICVNLDDVDCAKNNQLFTFDKLTQEAIKEIKVKSMEQLHEGCRVAAFWSSKTKYLYPGRIGKLSDNLNTSTTKKGLVLIHFDDGDKTKISMQEIRLLPTDFELKQLDTDEENSSKSSNKPAEEKKVEKLKIKLNNTTKDQLVKKKKKKHSKERHHKHHHKKHRNHNKHSDNQESIKNKIDDDEDDNDEWWSKVQTDQQWKWKGKSIYSKSTSKSKKSKNTFYNAIIRGDEMIELNDCAVFLSAGRPSLPFIGRIVKMWENPSGNMIVNVKWFYHPEETKKPYPKLVDTKGALFESSAHYDDNDVQTISRKVLVLSYKDYLAKKKETKGSEDEDDIYYFSGVYNPAKKQIISIDKSVPMRE